ncbi:hypothetical protein CLAFUW4_12781 [Fulvia fulva]|uniref:Uncharacterized protein n=1 Tax=Passalora fulva TaxID=5499 RepID=A0A9Q8UVA1_PASFU|nr:uncharacterized protein CLAFUR5_12648 [Fulvia fulva]KAK4611658.1 hypothetical protein CLAFUR4_12785 [Fulvia fulva]KAK4612982.1 hypothetical protein CLAFUR0_12791 [Fulvia fulva]UJO23753.1 hypothetical protein CLAFUR5_12648 [Fulvia fulva]WPV20865.1 hypothetical protein CLAFUW4_12781 [Fulvia fulva]WPV35987.1 hypothetical protein CLAFUW7_12788 [Fulvia fulva]
MAHSTNTRTYSPVHIPIDDPPYEDPPDFAAAPPHFDSCTVLFYWDPNDAICQDDEAFSDEFSERTGKGKHSPMPSRTQHG